MRIVVQVHEGAWNIPARILQPHIDGVSRAYAKAVEALAGGMPPLDAAVTTLAVIEDDPT